MGNSVAACGLIISIPAARVAPDQAAAAAAGSLDSRVEDLQAEMNTIGEEEEEEEKGTAKKAESKKQKVQQRICRWAMSSGIWRIGKKKKQRIEKKKDGGAVARLVYCDGHVQEFEGAAAEEMMKAGEVLKRAPYSGAGAGAFIICDARELSAFTDQIIGGGSSTATISFSSSSRRRSCSADHGSCSSSSSSSCSSVGIGSLRRPLQLAADDVLQPGSTYFLLPAHIFQLHSHRHAIADDPEDQLLLRATYNTGSGGGGGGSAAAAADDDDDDRRRLPSCNLQRTHWSPSLRTIHELLLP